MEKQIKIGFIGSGKVGCSLGLYFLHHHIQVSGYYSKTKASSEFAAKLTQTNDYDQINQLVEESTVILITVTDDQIKTVWKQLLDQIEPNKLKDKYVFHCSGIHSSMIFSENERNQLQVGSLHPICAISDKKLGYKNLQQALFSFEGTTQAKYVLEELLRKTKNVGVELETNQKARYHAATVFSSNLMIGLLKESMDILIDCGFTKQQAETAVVSLAVGNLKNIEVQGLEDALTGPIERNDDQTIQLHLEALVQQERLVYQSLSNKIIPIAERKHPDRDYSKIKEMLQNEKYDNDNVSAKN